MNLLLQNGYSGSGILNRVKEHSLREIEVSVNTCYGPLNEEKSVKMK